MQTQTPDVNVGNEKKEKKTGSVAFILSVLFHGGILLMIGGIVLIPAVVQKSAFTADPNMVVPTDIQMDEPPDAAQDQNDLPPSQAPQENMQLSETPAPAAQNDLFVAREDTSGAASSWAGLAASAPVDIKTPKFDKKDDAMEEEAQKQKKMSVGSRVTLFGSTETTDGVGLAGTFYDFKRTKGGRSTYSVGEDYYSKWPHSAPVYGEILRKFTDSGWNTDNFKKYWSASNLLYLHQICIPPMKSDEAPKAFEVKADGSAWIIHYKGYVTPPRSGEYRFAGSADDVLIVRFNNQNVLDGSIAARSKTPVDFEGKGKGTVFYKLYVNWPSDNRIPEASPAGVVGDWVSLERGKSYPMEILLGERPGGGFNGWLFVQRKGDATWGVFSTEPTLSPEISKLEKISQLSAKAVYFKPVKAP